jgi:site-specific recombinase XerD
VSTDTIECLVEICMTEAKTKKRLANTSINGYRWYLRQFAKWMGDSATPAAITDTTRPEYIEHVNRSKEEGGPGYSPQLVHCINASIMYFYRWLLAHPEKYLLKLPNDRDAVLLPKIVAGDRRVTTPDLALRMIAACDRLPDPYRAVLVRTMITVYNDIPLRRNELLDLELRDINLNSGLVHIRHGKGDKEGWNHLSDDGIAAIKAYLAVRPKTAIQRLWIHDRFRYVGENWLYGQITILCEIAGIADRKDVLHHAYRRGVATRHRKTGADMQVLKTMLRHASSATTEIYIEASQSELAEHRNDARLFADPPAPHQVPAAALPPVPPAAATLPPGMLVKRRNDEWRRRFEDRK